MRFLWILTATLLTSSAISAAQQQKYFHPKPSSSDVKTERRSVPPEKMPAKSATAKDLRNIERQTAKAAPARRAPASKQPVALKPRKEKNPPINFGRSSKGGAAMVNQGTNPYKGRLKQKQGGH